ncbi:MAG: HIG1 domain-containing protein [Pseudomonadota bacterium]|nr:HIG1 domain-containing protein [Pseudomonadota bacterium]
MRTFLIFAAVAAVAVVLIGGVSTMFVDGSKARLLSNKMMRLRVLAQFIALIIIGAVAYCSSGH